MVDVAVFVNHEFIFCLLYLFLTIVHIIYTIYEVNEKCMAKLTYGKSIPPSKEKTAL
jgi:hypothetical protein